MSRASEKKRMSEALAGYSLMSIPELAELLDCSAPTARELVEERVIPSVPVGSMRKVDPIDACVHVLAGREGISPEEYWDRHGEATAELAGKYYRRVMRFKGAA